MPIVYYSKSLYSAALNSSEVLHSANSFQTALFKSYILFKALIHYDQSHDDKQNRVSSLIL